MGYFVSSLSKEATSAWLNASEYALLIFAVVVVVGVVGEHKRAWPHPAAELFSLLVAIGCAGELVADGGVYVFSRHLQTINEYEVVELQKDNLDLQKVLQPRRVNVFFPLIHPEKVSAAKKLNEFSGTPIVFQSVPYFEAEMLENDLVAITNGFKWKSAVVADWRATGISPVTIHDGIEFWTWLPEHQPPADMTTPRDKAWLAADALCNVIRLNGVLCAHGYTNSPTAPPFVSQIPTSFKLPENGVLVLIGMKNIQIELDMLKDEQAKKHE